MIEIDDDLLDLLDIERAAMSAMMLKVAGHRDGDPGDDPRSAEAARCLRRMAGTMRNVSDDLLLDVATLHNLAGDMIGKLITAKLFAVAFDLPAFADATAFYQSFADIIGEAATRVRKRRIN